MHDLSEVRKALRERLRDDLIGPIDGERERIGDLPTEAYLTGILWPQGAMQDLVEDDGIVADDSSDDSSGTGQQISMRTMHKPHSMGASFRVREADTFTVTFRGARYSPEDSEVGQGGRTWVRSPIALEKTLGLEDGHHSNVDMGEDVRMHLWVRDSPDDGALDVTLVIMNGKERSGEGYTRTDSEMACIMQCEFEVTLPSGEFIPRPLSTSMIDEDERVNRLIYRQRRTYASGHGCSASWHPEEGPRSIRGVWLPEAHVPSMDPKGSPIFEVLAQEKGLSLDQALSAAEIATSKGDERRRRLEVISDGYRRWLEDQSHKAAESNLDDDMTTALRSNLEMAEGMLERIERGIELVVEDPAMSVAFGIAMDAMARQSEWGDDRYKLVWRPFQLAFQLLCIPAFSSSEEEIDERSREEMDLLWFPTGGGKTEAYLGLIALVVALRRMGEVPSDVGSRTTSVMMRYTLRTLTNQQFERACKLVMALEQIRRDGGELGSERFLIGLWVGESGSPNKVKASRDDNNRKAEVLDSCPCCKGPLDWDPEWRGGENPAAPWYVSCASDDCVAGGGRLPVHVIDETLYKEPPDILIGTVDKFAQITRNSNTHPLVCDLELILQDELHLISGPLGSVDGLYEAALDIIASDSGRRPKILGSTATIRRAADQVKQLYNRPVTQFPPAVLDWSDSCFAVVDESIPGRIYTGLTSTGRSPKFALQAAYSSLLQATEEWRAEGRFGDDEVDPFRTLLGYFNSRREVGGAGILVRDDVRRSMRGLSARRGTQPREIPEGKIEEVTARMSSDKIPQTIARIAKKHIEEDSVDVALATNMISVGVDLPRLGLMVVAGQPKAMSEYIQATSRVGRGSTPGLILTLYNDGKARDRAHYESHVGWLMAPYREVEANSVTPFSPRSRDRALAAVVVAIARHTVSGMLDEPVMSSINRRALETQLYSLMERVEAIDSSEASPTRREINDFLDKWQNRWEATDHTLQYWNERNPSVTLLMSLESVAQKVASDPSGRVGLANIISAPNSMRNVEPQTLLKLIPGLAPKKEADS